MMSRSPAEEAASRYTGVLAKHIQDHLGDFLRHAPDIATLVISGRGTLDQEAKFSLGTRDGWLKLLAGETHPNALYCADSIRSITAKNVIPCVFWVDFPGGEVAIQVRSVVYVPHGMQRGGDA